MLEFYGFFTQILEPTLYNELFGPFNLCCFLNILFLGSIDKSGTNAEHLCFKCPRLHFMGLSNPSISYEHS